MGAGRLRTFFSVTLPLAAPGILVAMVLAFLASLDEAQGTFLVGVPNYVTMPVQMYSLVSDYPPEAAAVFSVLLAVPSVGDIAVSASPYHGRGAGPGLPTVTSGRRAVRRS